MSVRWILLMLSGAGGLAGSASGQSFLSGGLHELGVNGEWLAASDIKIKSYSADWSREGLEWGFEANVSRNAYDIEYEPTIIGVAEELDEATRAYSAGLTRKWSTQLSSTLGGRYYDGFSNYRSIWIAEFYRQFFGTFPQYEAPAPEGYGGSFSTVWQYSPGIGQIELSYDFGHDTIAPGWDIDPNSGVIAPGNDALDTHSGTIRLEHALASRMKVELTGSVRDTTNRDPRYSGSGRVAAAVGPLAVRLGIGYAEEDPEYEALYGDVLIEWGFAQSWVVYTGGRLYNDTGEIENTGFNILAPELDSSEVFIGVRHETPMFSVNLSIGMLDTDYEDVPPTEAFLGELYRDRDWWNGRLSLAYKF